MLVSWMDPLALVLAVAEVVRVDQTETWAVVAEDLFCQTLSLTSGRVQCVHLSVTPNNRDRCSGDLAC